MLSPDTLFALMCLIVGIAIPVVPVVLVGVRARRQLRTSSAYREVARALGLDVDTRGNSLHGVRQDRPLWVGEVLVGEGPDRRREVHGVLGFRQPLGLGLELRTRRGRREPTDGLDQPDLDKRLVVHAHHQAGLQAVRRDDVLRVLAFFTEHSREIHLSDERLRVRLRRPPDTVDALGSLVERLEAAAGVLEAAGAEVEPPEAVQAWRPVLEQVAAAHGLEVSARHVQVRGALCGWPLRIVPNHVGGSWCAWLALRFAPDVDTGFRVHPQRSPDGDDDGQDIVVGDPTFDDAFVVKGYDPEAVRTRLDAEVRAALLGLLALGPVSLDDHSLIVRRLDVADLSHALDHARVLAERLVDDAQDVRIIDVG